MTIHVLEKLKRLLMKKFENGSMKHIMELPLIACKMVSKQYYIKNRMERNQHSNFVKPSLKEIVNWVKNFWHKITNTCVTNALRSGYVDRKCSFKESSIARHEIFEPKVLQEIESQ